jgi:hypothetical protein
MIPMNVLCFNRKKTVRINYNDKSIKEVRQENMRFLEPRMLRYERTNYGKEIRKKYESREVEEKIGNMRLFYQDPIILLIR